MEPKSNMTKRPILYLRSWLGPAAVDFLQSVRSFDSIGGTAGFRNTERGSFEQRRIVPALIAQIVYVVRQGWLVFLCIFNEACKYRGSKKIV